MARLGTFAVALATLLREDKNYVEHKSLIESAVISYLKETKQYDDLLNEQGEVISIDEEPITIVSELMFMKLTIN